jgi:folate-binding Fe-S cluster repair protein YgfZ
MLSSNDLIYTIAEPSGHLCAAPCGWLRVTGPDAAAFLQGQCTQELRALQPGQWVRALWLTTKGRILGESLVLRDSDEVWWLWSAHTAGSALRARLEDFIIADDVVIEELGSAGWVEHTLAGAAAEVFECAERGLCFRGAPEAGSALDVAATGPGGDVRTTRRAHGGGAEAGAFGGGRAGDTGGVWPE